MTKVDMSAKAVTARLRRVSELRRLCLSLQKAKLLSPGEKGDPKVLRPQPSSNQDGQKGR